MDGVSTHNIGTAVFQKEEKTATHQLVHVQSRRRFSFHLVWVPHMADLLFDESRCEASRRRSEWKRHRLRRGFECLIAGPLFGDRAGLQVAVGELSLHRPNICFANLSRAYTFFYAAPV